MSNTMTLKETITQRGREFYVVKDERGFWGIESSNFDSDGKLKVKLTGISGLLTDSQAATAQLVRDRIEVEFLTSTGMDNMEALKAVFAERLAKATGGK